MKHNDWDDDAYVRIVDARYDPGHDELTVRFADGESISLAAWRLLRSTTRAPDWANLGVVDGYHITVSVAAGSGDLGTDETDIPGTTIRAISDPLFAAHMARHAEDSARRSPPQGAAAGARPHRATGGRVRRHDPAERVAHRAGTT